MFDIYQKSLNHRSLIPINFCRRWRGSFTPFGIRPTRAFRPGLHSAAAARPGSSHADIGHRTSDIGFRGSGVGVRSKGSIIHSSLSIR